MEFSFISVAFWAAFIQAKQARTTFLQMELSLAGFNALLLALATPYILSSMTKVDFQSFAGGSLVYLFANFLVARVLMAIFFIVFLSLIYNISNVLLQKAGREVACLLVTSIFGYNSSHERTSNWNSAASSGST